MPAVVEISGVEKSWPAPGGAAPAVVSIESFRLEAGDELAIRGRSGSGKTTFLNLISGILLPDRGTIRVAGADITTLSEPERDRHRAGHTGYVFQSFNLLQGYTALENVTLAMRFAGKRDDVRARQLLERVGLGDRIHYRPVQLSAGQQQRVAIARALANRPQLVLADEPTGNLDAAAASGSLALLREVCREAGAALLVVSHDEETLKSFGRVLSFSEINRAPAARTEAAR